MSTGLSAADPWLRPEWGRAALLTIDTQVDFAEGGASPIPGTAAVVVADAVSGVDDRHLREAGRLGAPPATTGDITAALHDRGNA